MIAFSDLTGLASSAVALAAVSTRLPGVARIRRFKRILLAGAVAIAALVPFGGLPLAGYLRGAIGDLSITSLLLLTLAMARHMLVSLPEGEASAPSSRGAVNGKSRLALLLLVALAAAWLYPLALGIGLFDPYRLGYGNPWFVGALLLVALAACFTRYFLPAGCIALAVFAWSAGWYESNNLWDYLLDPLLAVYATGALAGTMRARIANRKMV